LAADHGAQRARRRTTVSIRLSAPKLALCASLLSAACTPSALRQGPLAFPTEPEQRHEGSVLRRPAGDGPFPAVVLLPTCAGVGGHVHQWAGRLTTAGYATLVVDSLTPRGVRNNCQGAAAPVTLDDVAADASAALAHLRALAFI
jgi:hypothetical protein